MAVKHRLPSMTRFFLNSKRTKVLGLIAIAILALILLILVVFGTPIVKNERAAVFLPSLIATGIAGLGITRARSWRRGIDILEPPVFISIWCVAFYIFPTVTWALGLSSIRVNPVISDDLAYWLSMSCWLTAAGLGSIWAGYLFVTRHKRSDFRPPVQSAQSLHVGIATMLYIAGVLIRFLLYTYGLRGNAGVFREFLTEGMAGSGVDQIINLLVKCLAATGPALFIYAFSSPRTNRSKTGWAVAILASEGFLGILSGSRGGVLLTLFFFAAYFRYCRGRYPNKKLVPIAALLLILSVPIINQIRNETVDLSGMNPWNFMRAFRSATQETIAMHPSNWIDAVLAVAFDRQMSAFQIQAAAMRLHPSILPFKGIETLVFFPMYLVPRPFWPNKPILYDALEATSLYTGETALSFSSPILPADLYSLAGWPMVFIGMFVFGVLQGSAYRYLVGKGTALELVLFTMIYFELSHWEGQLAGILAILLVSTPLFWLFLKFVLFGKSGKLRKTNILKQGRSFPARG